MRRSFGGHLGRRGCPLGDAGRWFEMPQPAPRPTMAASSARSDPATDCRTRSEAGADSAARSRHLRSGRSTPFHRGEPAEVSHCGVAQFGVAAAGAGPVALEHPSTGSGDWRRSGTRLGCGCRKRSVCRQGWRDRRTGCFNRSGCAEAHRRRGALECLPGEVATTTGWRRRRSGPLARHSMRPALPVVEPLGVAR